MIRSYFGVVRNPFDPEGLELLDHQREILEVLRAHCQQGGLCLIVGEPGTGKTAIRSALQAHDPKRLVTPTVGRTLHSYHNTLRILCQAFEIEFEGIDFKCERRLIDQAFNLHRMGKMLAVLIDDAHLMPVECLRRLRLLFEEFPKNHNLVLFSQAEMLRTLRLTVNQDIHSRLTYSATVRKLAPDAVEAFVLVQFDRCGLPHNTLTHGGARPDLARQRGRPARRPQSHIGHPDRDRPRPKETGRHRAREQSPPPTPLALHR